MIGQSKAADQLGRRAQRLSLMTSKRARHLIAVGVAYVLLAGGGLLMFAPFLWMVSSSLKDAAYIFQYPPQWIPAPPPEGWQT